MFKIQCFSRNENGNKDQLLFTCKYPKREQALSARQTLIKISKGGICLAPRDIMCIKENEPEFSVVNNVNYIVGNIINE